MIEMVIFGTGGHAKVIHDVVLSQAKYEPVAFFSLDTSLNSFLGLPVYDQNNLNQYSFTKGLIAIGDNSVRERVSKFVMQMKPSFEFVTAVHPTAHLAADVTVGVGSVIMAGSVLNPGVSVGEHVIINTGSLVDHDGQIGNFSSLAPGSILGGNVNVGQQTAVSLGTRIIHGCSIGDYTVIGAGSLVLTDISNSVLAYGSPCEVIRQRNHDEKYL